MFAPMIVAQLLVKGRSGSLRATLKESQEEQERLKARHAELKAAVTRAAAGESRSLQVYGMARALAEALSWKDMAPHLTSGIQKVFGGFEFLLYAIDESGRSTLLHRRGTWVNEPPLKGDTGDECRFLVAPQVAELAPVLTVPIFINAPTRRRNGLLFIKPSKEELGEADLIEIGQEVSEQLGLTLSKAQLFMKMEMHSREDGLTGTLRRQAFMDRLTEEFKRASLFHTEFSLLMVDIDFFKHVNDSYGHAAGDAVLSRMGHLLKESFYETDVVGRYGGEEFIVLLPRAELEGVMRKAEALRRRLESETIQFGFEKIKITISIGVAHYPSSGRTAEELIGRADKALYQAKETGRNRVIAA
jgi:diguanylate cyclase (GGDEF)-like protein